MLRIVDFIMKIKFNPQIAPNIIVCKQKIVDNNVRRIVEVINLKEY